MLVEQVPKKPIRGRFGGNFEQNKSFKEITKNLKKSTENQMEDRVEMRKRALGTFSEDKTRENS